MARLGHYVVKFKQAAFIYIGIEVAAHGGISHIGSPSDKMVYCTLRAVGIIYLEPITEADDIVTDRLEAVGSPACKLGVWSQITVYAASNKVVGAVIAYFQDNIRNHICNGNKVT